MLWVLYFHFFIIQPTFYKFGFRLFEMSTYIQNQFWLIQKTNPLKIHDVIVARRVAISIKENQFILVVESDVFQVLLNIKSINTFWRCSYLEENRFLTFMMIIFFEYWCKLNPVCLIKGLWYLPQPLERKVINFVNCTTAKLDHPLNRQIN